MRVCSGHPVWLMSSVSRFDWKAPFLVTPTSLTMGLSPLCCPSPHWSLGNGLVVPGGVWSGSFTRKPPDATPRLSDLPFAAFRLRSSLQRHHRHTGVSAYRPQTSEPLTAAWVSRLLTLFYRGGNSLCRKVICPRTQSIYGTEVKMAGPSSLTVFPSSSTLNLLISKYANSIFGGYVNDGLYAHMCFCSPSSWQNFLIIEIQ